ncbi:acyltransferase family protein [Butyrivibrio sp. MC2013]|uniref:acyltransferase family protein n=1 Tax=Butyrivibrio sp. MC2013 TaxID=1280686 RepID=UPI0004203AA6|nr:acyltransferase family protein [Butyrivibrio sp. MC2013]
MKTERKKYIDYIKAIGIILVIIGHINFANSYFGIKSWIYSFHMPLFFFATGLAFKQSRINLSFIIRKIQVLIVPYFIWAMIYSELNGKNILYILYGSYKTLGSANSLTSLWFLPTMLIAVIISQIVINVVPNIYLQAIISFIFYVIAILLPGMDHGYPWCIDVGILASSFILFGYIFNGFFIEKHNRGITTYIVLFILGCAGSQLYRLNNTTNNGYVLMAKRSIGNPIVFIIVAVSGCLMVLGMAKILEFSPINKSVLSFLGINTMAIFAVHKPLITVMFKVFSLVSVPWGIELIMSVVVVTAISCCIANSINCFVPILGGKT